MKENRHFRIIYALLRQGRMTAPKLAEELDVSVRTIYRDIDALSGSGIPVYVTTGRNGGIQLLDSFILRKALLSGDEKTTLLTALESLSKMTGGGHHDLLMKLSALFNARAESLMEIDFSRWGNEASDTVKYERIRKAAFERKALSIVYVSSWGKRKTRKIYPLKLSYKAKDWYLKARCAETEAFRLFKINRILACEVLNEEFAPLEYPEETASVPESCEEITLRFPKEFAWRVYDEFTEGQIRETRDGELTVTAVMPVDGWLVGYLLSFGAAVDVIRPGFLRGVLAREAAKIMAKNKP